MRIRFLLIPCLMMSILTFIFESVPQYDQEIVLTGKYNAVVVYDVHGIPTISGDTYLDVMYGLGYVHAQDRLWQLHYRRMLAQGKMASILGDEWFEMDKYLRNAGYLESARRIVQKMDSRTRELIQTYADGINYGVSKLTKLPIEFDLIDAEFQPWTILDTVAFIKYFNLLTSNELYSELMKQQVSAVYSKNITAILTGIGHLRQYHPEQSIISDLELKAVGDLYQEYKEYQTEEEQYNPEDDFKVNGDAQIFEINPEMGGSNSWVVSGKLTDTGFPILANDPHLENLMPSQWYLVNLVMKDNFIKGGSMPGTPTIPVGRSKKFSWGSTILYFDNVDLYEEKLKKVDGKLYYLFKDEWLPCTEFQEEIDNLGVKQTFTFYKTQHGPIMEYFYDRKSHQIVRFQGNFSLKATVYDDDYCFYMTLLDFQLGDDFKKGLEGFKCVTTLNQGMVFASEKDIGFVPVGKQIIRTGNPDSWGIPKQGWTGEVEWVRFLTPEEHPIIINPDKGYIISSNQRLFTRNVKYYLSHGVYSGPRPHRIDVVLRSAKNFSVQDTMNLQNDLVDQYPKETIQVLFQYLDWNNTKHKQFMDIIGQWDFRYSLESTEATLFAIFELYYIDTFMYLTQGWKKGYDFDSFFFKNILEFSYNQPWCNNTKNSATPCLDNLRNSVDKAIDKYEKLSDKTWKTHHTQFFPHTAFENEFDGEFNRQIPHVGFRRCVQNSKTELVLGSSLGVGGPNMRAVISMKPGDQAYFMIDTGQSGNPLSEHYDDLMQKWNRDEYVTIGTSSIDIE